MLRVVLCAQNVVDTPKAAAAARPAQPVPLSRRAACPTRVTVKAPLTAPIKLTRQGIWPMGSSENSLVSRVNMA